MVGINSVEDELYDDNEVVFILEVHYKISILFEDKN